MGNDGSERGQDFATESLERWAPRFVANVVDPNDLDRLRGRIDSWADWCDAFAAVGDEHVALGEAAADRDDREGIDDLDAPALMVTGANDRIIAPAQTERIASRAPNGEFVLYEDGNHVCNDISYRYRPYAADWLRRRLA